MQVLRGLRPTISAERAPGCAILRVENWSRYRCFSGTSQSKRPSDTSAVSSAFDPRSTTGSASNPRADSSGTRSGLPTTLSRPSGPHRTIGRKTIRWIVLESREPGTNPFEVIAFST